MSNELVIRRVTARVFRCPLEQPVTTSFGTMLDRPMVLVEVEDDQADRPRRRVDALEQQCAIRQSGERVVVDAVGRRHRHAARPAQTEP